MSTSHFDTATGLSATSLFEDGRWFVFDDLTSMWGEGSDESEAFVDLLRSLVELRTSLRGNRLAPHLVDQLAYLEKVLPVGAT